MKHEIIRTLEHLRRHGVEPTEDTVELFMKLYAQPSYNIRKELLLGLRFFLATERQSLEVTKCIKLVFRRLSEKLRFGKTAEPNLYPEMRSLLFGLEMIAK